MCYYNNLMTFNQIIELERFVIDDKLFFYRSINNVLEIYIFFLVITILIIILIPTFFFDPLVAVTYCCEFLCKLER